MYRNLKEYECELHEDRKYDNMVSKMLKIMRRQIAKHQHNVGYFFKYSAYDTYLLAQVLC